MNEPTEQAGAERRRRQVAALVSTGVFMASLDLFIVNIAFPGIAADYQGHGLSDLSWVLNAYAIVFAAALVPAGRWFDRLGRRRGFLAGVAMFGVASAICAAAPSLEVLIAARVLQAIGAAFLVPTSLGLMLPEYPPEQRAKAVALWSAVGGVAAAAGPPIGGLLVELDWRWVFLVNVPIAAGALLIGRGLLVERRDPQPGPAPDVLGALLLAAAVAVLTWAIVEAPTYGWTGARTVGGFVGTLLLGAAFVARSSRHPSPVVPPAIVVRRSFSAATLASLAFFIAFAAMLLNGVLVLSELWGWSTLQAGFALMPGPAMAAAVASRGAVFGARFGQRTVAAAGSLVFGAGQLVIWATLDAQPGYLGGFLPGMVISGVGVGLVLPSMAGAAFGGLPPALLSTGIAVFSVARQVGSALGVALLVAVLGDLAGSGVAAARDGYLMQAGVGVLAAALALAIGRGGALAGAEPATAERAAPAPPEVRA